jgi:acyl carrier protein
MLRQIAKKNFNQYSMLLKVAQRGYIADGGLMKRDVGEYYNDPMDIAERVVRLFALHDACKDPSSVTLGKTFSEVGLNALDMVELFIGCEREFDLEIAEEECE